MISLYPLGDRDPGDRRALQRGVGRTGLGSPVRLPRTPLPPASLEPRTWDRLILDPALCHHRPFVGPLLRLLALAGRVLAAASVIALITLGPQFVFGGAAHAAEPKASDGNVPAVGEVIVNGKPSCSAGGGHGLDLGCLNNQLQTAAKAGDPASSVTPDAVRDAQTPSKAGTFSQTATAERLGKNFGKSAQPYRPPAPVYSNSILPTGAPR